VNKTTAFIEGWRGEEATTQIDGITGGEDSYCNQKKELSVEVL